VAQVATDLAIAKAKAAGVAIVGAHNTWYTGMFTYYLEQVAGAGFVGIAAGSGAHIVAPHGSSEARFATNPIAAGFPTEGQPIIWDIGTSQTMLAEVLFADRQGHQLPEGRLFDAEGRPSTTPMDVLGGALTVWGGHKGSGLALVVQMLGALAGASYAPDGLQDCGFLLVTIDPDLLTDGDDFRRRTTHYADSVRAARPLDPSVPVRMPFDRSTAERERRHAHGTIEIDDHVYESLVAVSIRAVR
jgi:LDH2 family malate/lactate/ureidoglycolate dehydrogenase